METLARPKERKDGAYRDPEWRVTKGSRNAQASSRVQVIQRYFLYCMSILINNFYLSLVDIFPYYIIIAQLRNLQNKQCDGVCVCVYSIVF